MRPIAIPVDVLQMLQQIPASMHELVMEFPPGSTVQAKALIGRTLAKHRQIAEGAFCLVISYQEPQEKFPKGIVWVAPDGETMPRELTPARPGDLRWISNRFGLGEDRRIVIASLLKRAES